MEKTLHFIWYQGISTAPLVLQNMPNKWKALNPDYTIKIWDKTEINKFIWAAYPEYVAFFASIGQKESEKVRIIKRCDFARLLILFSFGGAYVDLDCEPIRPIQTLFTGGVVEHVNTIFSYSRNCSHPSTLPENGHAIAIDFKKYEMILSREHTCIKELGGYTIGNAFMIAKAFSPVLNDMIVSALTRVNEKVLSFAGPHGISSYIRSKIGELQGRVLVLPPYYFLWQVHDMGHPWKNTICCHHNRMDWVDKEKGGLTPWNV